MTMDYELVILDVLLDGQEYLQCQFPGVLRSGEATENGVIVVSYETEFGFFARGEGSCSYCCKDISLPPCTKHSLPHSI